MSSSVAVPSQPGVPIHTLPDELLLQIFLLLLYDSPRPWNPWRLASICRRWWYHSLSSPQLWTSISFSPHSCEKGKYNVGDVMRTYLQVERSKACKLSINADDLCLCCASHLAKLQILIAHSNRWETASFLCVQPVHLPSMQATLQEIMPDNTYFPNLHELLWGFPSIEPVDNAAPPRFPFSGGPSNGLLTNLGTVLLARCRDLTSCSTIPWPQLTSLILNRYEGTIPCLLSVLSELKSLLKLHLSLIDDLPELEADMDEDSHVTLPLLRSLLLHDLTDDGVVYQIVPYLLLPSLDELTIGFRPSNEVDNIEAVTDLIIASSISVRELEWDGVGSGVYIAPLLQECPELESLTITGSEEELEDRHAHRELIRQLALLDEQSVCPQLKKIDLHNLRVDPIVLIEMLESRLSHCGRNGWNALKEVRVVWVNDGSSWTLPPDKDGTEYRFCVELLQARLEKYKADGLKLEITFGI